MPDVVVHRPANTDERPLTALTWFDRLRPVQERSPLIVDSKVPDFLRDVHEHTYTLVSAPTGVGKSTRLVQALWAAGYLALVSQPRVIAAIGLANRGAQELESPVGETVGYRTANYKSYGPDTAIQYMTAGYMIQWLMNGGLDQIEEAASRLGRRPVIVLDEVHEGDADTEFLLAWIQHLNERGAGIKVVVMSATLNKELLEQYLDHPKTVEIEGRKFPIDLRKPTGTDLEAIKEQVEAGRGVLYFLPGKREIGDCERELAMTDLDAVVLPLHGELSLVEQERIFAKHDAPIVVPSTRVAESSITVPNISVVLMSGISREMAMDETGMRFLNLVPTSRASLDQQAGRAGRTEPGIAIGPFRFADKSRRQFSAAESELAPPWDQVLRTLAMGFSLDDLSFLHGSAADLRKRTYPLLTRLGLLDSEGQITEKGREVASYPTTVRGGCMLYQAQRAGVLESALDAVAAFEAGGVIEHDDDSWKALCPVEGESELLAQGEIVRKMGELLGDTPNTDQQANSPYDPEQVDELCQQFSVKAKNIVRALECRKLMRERFGLAESAEMPNASRTELLKSFAAGLFDFRYKLGDAGECLSFNEKDSRFIGNLSVIDGGGVNTLVGWPINVMIDDGNGGKVRKILPFASRFNPRWLAQIAPHLAREVDGPASYSPKEDVVMAPRELRVDGYTVSTGEFSAIQDRKRAASVFADWFTGLMLGEKPHRSLHQNADLMALIERNRSILERRRAPADEVRRFFTERLGGATCLKELPAREQLLFKRAAA